jgi:hypothetical protein
VWDFCDIKSSSFQGFPVPGLTVSGFGIRVSGFSLRVWKPDPSLSGRLEANNSSV